jgi:hypothetical protein
MVTGGTGAGKRPGGHAWHLRRVMRGGAGEEPAAALVEWERTAVVARGRGSIG